MTDEVVWTPPTAPRTQNAPRNPFALALLVGWILSLAIAVILFATGSVAQNDYPDASISDGSVLIATSWAFTTIGVTALAAWLAVRAIVWDRTQQTAP